MNFPSRQRPLALRRLVCGAVAVAVTALASCGGETELTPQAVPAEVSATIAPYDVTSETPAATAALSLIPADASAIAVTDLDQVRAALGVPDLTSASPISERSDFWQRARRESVLLTRPMLLDAGAALMLRHGFTEDDVDWEAHFTTPAGAGWILGFRTDLDMAVVQKAVDQGVAGLVGGVVDTGQHLVSSGAISVEEAEGGVDTWGTIDGITELTSSDPAEAIYYRAGCVPLATALGADADDDDKEAVVSAHDPAALAPLTAFSVSFADGLATARLGAERPGLFDRADLAADFPTVGPIGFADAFKDPVVDPSTGRIGYTVVTPMVAETATLGDLLPFAVCNEVEATQEPSGL